MSIGLELGYMLCPKDVFENFDAYFSDFCADDDAEVEGQYFDRKEACRPKDNGLVAKSDLDRLRNQIMECVSAFANTNQLGGLLLLGIAKDGTVQGIDHLTDQQRISLTHFRGVLHNQTAQAKSVSVKLHDGTDKTLLLIYTPYTPDAICETVEANARAWRRNDAKNDLLDDRAKDQLRRDKRIVDFESGVACAFDVRDVDEGLLKEIRATWSHLAGTSLNDSDLLYELGAVHRDGDKTFFTKAGLLFFVANPQRVMPSACIRLLRYDCPFNAAEEQRGRPTLDKYFSGPLTKQIRDFRSVIKDSSLFRVFQIRRPDGGFDEQPEFPEVAVDEAVVNAVAHRDYAESWCIECWYFRDAFVVRNAGRVIQRNEPVPDHFSLAEQKLTHTPRNPKISDWLKQMRTASGAEFVRALAEGTKTMKRAMDKLSLPPPCYDVTAAETVVTLLSEPDRRLADANTATAGKSTEFGNLYPIQLRRAGSPLIERRIESNRRREFLGVLGDALSAKGWFIDSLKFGQLAAHRQGDFRRLSEAVDACVHLYPAYTFAVREFFDRAYLCIDYTLEVKNVLRISDLLQHLSPSDLTNRSAIARHNGWRRGRIIALDAEWVTLRIYEFEETIRIAAANAIPDLPVFLIKRVLAARNIQYDLSKAIKGHSLSATTGASHKRAEWTQLIAEELSKAVFPIGVFGMEAALATTPLSLVRDSRDPNGLQVRTLTEPYVEFGHHHESPDVRDGITRFGAYGDQNREIEVVPLVIEPLRNQMASLIDRLKTGRYKYHGSERTFHTRLTYRGIATVQQPAGILDECKRLLSENPTWVGDRSLSRVFLVHTPELGFAIDDITSPYFSAKRLLLESGVPCQMIDTPTLDDPNWKDLNLALNLVAKCGLAPWVLPEGIPDADFFVGLSYTQGRDHGAPRLMGYANVFNRYGRWLFYAGNTQTFNYDQRTERMGQIVEQTLRRMESQLSETPNIYFHYSARFSREDKDIMTRAAQSVRPNGVFTFVWINTHHPVRLYDRRPETDGSLSRGNYVVTATNQIFVSTTGYNRFRKSMGTPLMLEVSAARRYPSGSPIATVDPKALAMQILSLTKLNWSSTDSLCGEPITTKYAGDIAYLTASFLRQNGIFRLHPVLEETPWFI